VQRQIAFYSVTAALLSTLYVPLDIYIYKYSPRRLILALVGATTMTLAWICQVGFWTNCEVLSRDDNGLQSWCPQSAMHKALSGGQLNTPLQMAKFIIGYLTAFAYFGYLVVCAIAVHKARKLQEGEF
jgi:hypothetical protein